jgi:phage terminase large subunit-like protein
MRSTDLAGGGPIPPKSLKLLTTELGELRPAVSIEGWQKSEPLVWTPPPTAVPGAWFDVEAVLKVVRAVEAMRHTKGRWAGTPLVPDPWQVVWIIAPVFGWKYSLDDPDEERRGTRIIRTVWIEVPRKNGKSTLAAALGLVLLAADQEMGAEVYAAAASLAQARAIFNDAKRMANGSPELRRKLDVLTSVIKADRTGGIFRALSKAADTAHGLNVHASLVDEIHVHKSRDLIDALETGTGARAQPLIIYITTSDEGVTGSIYDELHERTRKIANRTISDPSHWGVIWAAGKDDDPFAEATWYKANPGLGKSPKLQYMREKAEKARTTPSFMPVFLRLHLNVRTRLETRWLNLAEWDLQPNIQSVIAEQLAGRECYGGLDLSATTDLTALSLVFPDAEHETLTSLHWFWLPDEDLMDRIRRDQVPYDDWAKQGWLTLTEGNVVDYEAVTDTLDHVRQTYDLRSLGHDRWQAGPVVQSLTKLGITAEPVGQTYQGMSAPSKTLERLVKSGHWVHGGNPVLRWMADNVEIITDKDGNIRPVKPDRRKTGKRVDGIHSSVMAIDSWERREGASAPAAGPAATGDDDESFFRPTSRLGI